MKFITCNHGRVMQATIPPKASLREVDIRAILAQMAQRPGVTYGDWIHLTGLGGAYVGALEDYRKPWVGLDFKLTAVGPSTFVRVQYTLKIYTYFQTGLDREIMRVTFEADVGDAFTMRVFFGIMSGGAPRAFPTIPENDLSATPPYYGVILEGMSPSMGVEAAFLPLEWGNSATPQLNKLLTTMLGQRKHGVVSLRHFSPLSSPAAPSPIERTTGDIRSKQRTPTVSEKPKREDDIMTVRTRVRRAQSRTKRT
jgi:hypothetical protein